MNDINKKQIALSGIQTSGNLHLGNYLGAILNWTKIIDKYDCFFFLADLHALTSDIDGDLIRESMEEILATYIASGINNENATIFLQSSIPMHSELAWIFNCITSIGQLSRMTQFKEKSISKKNNACAGLFTYPLLMAADILLYNPDVVPVGEDQKQHIELTRDIVDIINRKIDKNNKNIIPIKSPKALILQQTKRIMSLKDPTKKMSKSDENDNSRINLSDSEDIILKKIKKAVTDSIPTISYDRITRPAISNFIDIISALSDKHISIICQEYEGKGTAVLKKDLTDLLIAKIIPIQKRRNEILQDEEYLMKEIEKGKEKASKVAQTNFKKIKEIMGLNYYSNSTQITI